MRGVTLEAKMRTVGRAIGIEVEEIPPPSPAGFRAYCPVLDRTFSTWFVKASRAVLALKELQRQVYHARGEYVYKRQGGLCCFCGCKLPINAWETDHIKARSKGRDDRIENLRVCCTFGGCDGHRRRHGG